jgi:hypothetical protein
MLQACKSVHQYFGPLFVVRSIGRGRANHGFAMSTADIQHFKSTNNACKQVRKDGKLGLSRRQVARAHAAYNQTLGGSRRQ